MPSRVRRRYKVKGLTDRGADEMTFHNEQADQDMTVAAYYAMQYNLQCVQAPPSLLGKFSCTCWGFLAVFGVMHDAEACIPAGHAVSLLEHGSRASKAPAAVSTC